MRISDWSADVCSSDLVQDIRAKPDHLQVFKCDPPHFRRLRDMSLAKREGDVAPHRQRIDQRTALKQHAELGAHPLEVAPLQPGDILAIDKDLSSEERRVGKGSVSTCRSR